MVDQSSSGETEADRGMEQLGVILERFGLEAIVHEVFDGDTAVARTGPLKDLADNLAPIAELMGQNKLGQAVGEIYTTCALRDAMCEDTDPLRGRYTRAAPLLCALHLRTTLGAHDILEGKIDIRDIGLEH